MQIRKLRLLNYKSFADSGWLSFSSGFTVVIGKNNVGKTALLEAINLEIANKPHRSQSSDPGVPVNPQSTVDVEVQTTGQEFKLINLAHGGEVDVPVPMTPESQAERLSFAKGIYERPDLRLVLRVVEGNFYGRQYPSHGLFQPGNQRLYVPATPLVDKQSAVFTKVLGGDSDSMPRVIKEGYKKSIYVFRAERLNIGRIGATATSILAADGANLAAVLMMMQSNFARFNRFNDHVSEIFPTIKRVVVAPVGNQFEIRIWSVAPETEREDLAIPLQESGTGVGQVLAILYVAMTVEKGCIVIDEPNSFLHPGAAKKLVQILKQYKQHQYILATHSGDLIATAEPDAIQLVTWSKGESRTEELDRARLDDLKRILIEVGVSFSDLFGFDRAVWVEGPTEEACFPIILRKLRASMPLGLIFLAVKNTGDFEAKGHQKKLIWDIYNKLSAGISLLPSMVSFSFDRERRAQSDIDDLIRESKGRVHFLPRLAYENYLLVPEAIAAAINSVPRDGHQDVTIAQVQDWIAANGGGFGGKTTSVWSGDTADLRWLQTVDAPKLLKSLFDELSGVNLEYQKTVHSIALTEWLLEHCPNHLEELAEYIESLTTTNTDIVALA